MKSINLKYILVYLFVTMLCVCVYIYIYPTIYVRICLTIYYSIWPSSLFVCPSISPTNWFMWPCALLCANTRLFYNNMVYITQHNEPVYLYILIKEHFLR